MQGYSEQAFQMYELLDDADPSEEYHIDLMLAKYGGLRGIEKNKQDIKERVELYEATLPKTFDKVLKENGITRQEYKKQFLELKAYVQVVRDTLIPQYGNAYPEFPKEVHAQLLLFDAAREVEENMF